jgi:glucuronoarabinoxylan endo-1,4-beta-xylanase
MRDRLIVCLPSLLLAPFVLACSSSSSKTNALLDGSVVDGSLVDGGVGNEAGSGDAGAEGGAAEAGKLPGTPGASDVIVAPDMQHQPIDGFGAADVWGSALTDAQVKLFFDPVAGIGLSLLRIGIETTGAPMGSGAVKDAQNASAYGVKVWAAPWSPPAMDKNNGDVNDGGTLLPTDYDSWASTLAAFPANFKAMSGVQLYGISAQNEPDFVAPTYESCVYTAAEMVAFLKVLGPKLAALNPPVNLLAPEPDTWNNLWTGDDFGTAILLDPAANAAVSIFATHDYAHNASPPPAGVKQHLWETEVSDLHTTPDSDITNGVQVAQWVYSALVTGGANAWHYWWLINLGTPSSASPEGGAEGLLLYGGDTTNPPKRLYTVGNFSKFVRPGYVRIDVSGPVPAGVEVVAFENPADATTVIVAINSNTTDTALPLFVGGSSWPSSVTPYVTSTSANLAAQPPIAVTDARFMATLGAQSVTTFVSTP